MYCHRFEGVRRDVPGVRHLVGVLRDGVIIDIVNIATASTAPFMAG